MLSQRSAACFTQLSMYYQMSFVEANNIIDNIKECNSVPLAAEKQGEDAEQNVTVSHWLLRNG